MFVKQGFRKRAEHMLELGGHRENHHGVKTEHRQRSVRIDPVFRQLGCRCDHAGDLIDRCGLERGIGRAGARQTTGDVVDAHVSVNVAGVQWAAAMRLQPPDELRNQSRFEAVLAQRSRRIDVDRVDPEHLGRLLRQP